jgi:conjugal transfer mating pair stabilization protein TraG
MPDYQPYHRTGMVFASRLVEAASQFEITDEKFDANLKGFIHQCVFYDLLLNKYSINTLMSAPNVWALISANPSPARSFIYDGNVTTCKEGVRKLSDDWKQAIDSAAEAYGKRIYPNVAKDKAKSLVITDLPISYQYLTKLSESASDIMQQNLMANAISRGIVSMNAKLNAAASMESYAFARAQEQKRLTNKTLGDMAAHWLPLMKNAFEAIMYGSFIFIVLLSVFPFGMMIVKNYVYTLLWIQIWAPLYAIINLIVSYYAQLHSVAATDGALSLNAMSGILQINSDISGLAGYLTLSVPFLSAGLVKGMASTFTQLSQYVGGVTQSAGGTAAQEAVTGNMSLGNTSFGNHNAFNTSANHFDTSGRMSAGSFTTQMAGGSSLTLTADGSGVLDMRNSISNLGASINYAESLRASYSHQADRAFTAAKNDTVGFSEASNAAIRDVSELSRHWGKSTASGEGWNFSTNAATAQAIGNIQKMTQDFASRHNISYGEAANLLANAHVAGQASIGVGTGKGLAPLNIGGSVSGGMSRTAGHNSSTDKSSLFSEAQSYARDNHYSENVDMVQRAVKDHSLRTNSEEGNRLVENASASFDKAESFRHDMQSNLSLATSAREMAGIVAEKADSINVNSNQAFTDWLINQPGTDGKGRLGYRGAERLKQDPDAMMHYARQYAEQHQSSITSNWQHGLDSTKSEIVNRYQSHRQNIPTESMIETQRSANKGAINHQAHQQGLVPDRMIDHSAKKQTENLLNTNQSKVDAGKKDISHKGEIETNKVKEEQGRERSGSLWGDMWNDIDTKDH